MWVWGPMGAWEPMGAWGSGTTFGGSPGSACFVFAFVSTITSELGLEEMQPERVTANKQITAILNLRSIAKQYLICELRNFPVREGKQMKHHDYQ
jgi:hypothetical protein